MATLLIDIDKLRMNIQKVRKLCLENGVDLMSVLKVINGDEKIIRLFQQEQVKNFGFSRYPGEFDLSDDEKISLIRCLPFKSQGIATQFHISYHSIAESIDQLANCIQNSKKKHGIILVLEVGDLREGFLAHEIEDAVSHILKMKKTGLSFEGIAANFLCCSGKLPDQESLIFIKKLIEKIRRKFNIEVPTVSLGGSVILPNLDRRELPKCINQVIIGAAFCMGARSVPEVDIRGLSDHIVTLNAEVIEVRKKTNQAPGRFGKNAFGREVERGSGGEESVRAVLDVGASQVALSGLLPRVKGLEIISTNSEYTVVDLSNCQEVFEPGSRISFDLTYEGINQAFLCPYLDKKYVETSLDRVDDHSLSSHFFNEELNYF